MLSCDSKSFEEASLDDAKVKEFIKMRLLILSKSYEKQLNNKPTSSEADTGSLNSLFIKRLLQAEYGLILAALSSI